MSASIQPTRYESNTADYLQRARDVAKAQGLGFSGSLPPSEAWEVMIDNQALLVDVRTIEELRLVGRVQGARHIPWQMGLDLQDNPNFLAQLEQLAGGKKGNMILLCRSGKRSEAAAKAAFANGFQNVFNVLEGFEGDRDEQGQRGNIGGWRCYGLPWVQD